MVKIVLIVCAYSAIGTPDMYVVIRFTDVERGREILQLNDFSGKTSSSIISILKVKIKKIWPDQYFFIFCFLHAHVKIMA